MPDRVGIIICSRSDSRRIPEKPFVKINGKPILQHLVERLIPSGLHIYLAVPHFDFQRYRQHFYGMLGFNSRFSKSDLTITSGSSDDPLARMATVAIKNGLQIVVRICHDKIFVDPQRIKDAIELFQSSKLDYLYSSSFMDGSGFEIISTDALTKAAAQFKNVEHIGYAIHCVTDRTLNLGTMGPKSSHRLLIDYPEDLKVIELIMAGLGNHCTLEQAIAFLDENPFISEMNRLPEATIYTCAYNAEKWLGQCMGSVAAQTGFKQFEYLLVDDFSTDKTSFMMSRFASIYPNSKWFRNEKNLGLASSSNIALSHARGKYIIRLDADDYFIKSDCLRTMIDVIDSSGMDIVYPSNYYGSLARVQKGQEQHHVGGAIFRTRAANHVKFTDGLRGYEGLDFFTRARNTLKVGYHDQPMFFYRQHNGSLSRNNLEERSRIKKEIEEKNESTTQGNRVDLPAMQASHVPTSC